MANPYRYAGYRFDEATGLYYCWNRYYDPETYRFITRDIYPGELENPGTMNPYACCLGNPVAWVDVTGMSSISAEERRIFMDEMTRQEQILAVWFWASGQADVARDIYRMREEAEREARTRYGDDCGDHAEERANAYLHMLWSAWVANTYGSDVARMWGTAHEGQGASNPTLADKWMDLANNARGRALAMNTNTSNAALAGIVYAAVESGNAAIVVDGKWLSSGIF